MKVNRVKRRLTRFVNGEAPAYKPGTDSLNVPNPSKKKKRKEK
jgi:hypothetical protein